MAELGRLLEVAESRQRMDGQRTVPDPGVAVVPVPLTACVLWQAERGRRYRRAGGLVGQQFEGHRRARNHLAPPACVGRAAQPVAPERACVIGQTIKLGWRKRPRLAAHGLQHDPATWLGFPQGERGLQPFATALYDRSALAGISLACGMHGQLHAVGPEPCSGVGDLHRVLGAAIVECRLQSQLELHGAARDSQLPDYPMPVSRRARDDRHEVEHLTDAIGRHEPGDQHRRLGEVQLPRHIVAGRGLEAEAPAPVRIEQRGEHAGRIESRAAEEVDSAVSGHQRRRLQVADYPVITDVRVAVHSGLLQRLHGRQAARPDHRTSGHFGYR